MLVPRVGDEIYVDTSLSIDHGWDDRCGGIATVSWVGEMGKKPAIKVKEFPAVTFTWSFLDEEQEELAERFGTRRAHECPETEPCPYGIVV